MEVFGNQKIPYYTVCLCGIFNYDIILSPLYVANLRYYTGVFYRIINKNDVIAKGGEYKVENTRSVGFSIYTDNLLKDMDD